MRQIQKFLKKYYYTTLFSIPLQKRKLRRRLQRGASCNSSRKGAKDAKLAKEEKKGFVCYLRVLITRYAHLHNLFLLFPSRPLRLCVLCEKNSRGVAPKALTLRALN
jgi:hypothetical protein